MFLRKIAILSPSKPNRSTAILGGECSGILNWDDIPYPSFYPRYKELHGNFWTSDEVNMANDPLQYSLLTEKERSSFDKVIGLLASSDMPQTRIMMNLANYVSDMAVHSLFAVIGQQEAEHNRGYSYVLSSIVKAQHQKKVFEIPNNHPEILKRNKPIMEAYDNFIQNPTPETFVKTLVQSMILEGINFYVGFAFFYNLLRQQKMTGTGKMIAFINR